MRYINANPFERLRLALQSCDDFTRQEHAALNPEDDTPLSYKEATSRARIAEMVAALRLNRTPEADPETVKDELRNLIEKQRDAAGNCSGPHLWSPEELERTREANARADWGRLLRNLGLVRAETLKRYADKKHEQTLHS